MAQAQLVVLRVVHIVVVRQFQQVTGKMLQGLQLPVPGQDVVSRTYFPVRIDIGKGIAEHPSLRRGRFIRRHADGVFRDLSVLQHPNAKDQPGEREIRVRRILVRDIRPQLGIPENKMPLHTVHRNMEAVFRKKTAVEKIPAGIAVVDDEVQIQGGYLLIGHRPAQLPFLNHQRVSCGRYPQNDIPGIILVFRRHHAASFLAPASFSKLSNCSFSCWI